MKIIDKYLVKSFIPPFLMASLIALFVLVMQNLWLYLDDIMGKGVDFLVILEMMFYMSMSFVPLALPVGVLISSVLNFGTLGEKYELASMKSAGVSLMRVMAPLIIFSSFIALFSFITSNNIIPYSNLKFMTRLLDISRQKPALNLQTDIFNYDFSGYAIRIDKKDKNTGLLTNVLVYDHSDSRLGKVTILTAETGRMYTESNEKYLIMDLFNGNQYQETKGNSVNSSYPVIRSSFKKLTKVFDMSEFDLARSDEDRYKTREQMLNVSQLASAVDSLEIELAELGHKNVESLLLQTEIARRDSSSTRKIKRRPRKGESMNTKTGISQVDSLSDDIDIAFLNTFSDEDQKKLVLTAKNSINYQKNIINASQHAFLSIQGKIVRHRFELHFKYMLAVACIVFLFIGAPMGAIVRKGGYGYPMLIAIIFFMMFILTYDMSKNMVRKFTIDPILGAWLPLLILFPIGVFLTLKAARDSKFIDIDGIKSFFSRMGGYFTKNKSDE